MQSKPYNMPKSAKSVHLWFVESVEAHHCARPVRFLISHEYIPYPIITFGGPMKHDFERLFLCMEDASQSHTRCPLINSSSKQAPKEERLWSLHRYWKSLDLTKPNIQILAFSESGKNIPNSSLFNIWHWLFAPHNLLYISWTKLVGSWLIVADNPCPLKRWG